MNFKYKVIITIILLYELVFGILIFIPSKKVSTKYKEDNPVERFYSSTICDDRAKVLDTPDEGVFARINIIKSAKETLDISYYAIEKGQAATFFWGLLVDAADRGVKVRIILDGISNGVNFKQRDILYALYKHENIELKFYEKPNLLLPWTLNNRLHDKYIISDKTLAIIGGRNIGDRFWNPKDYDKNVTYDRDVLIYSQNNNKSVINDLKIYFNKIYNSSFSKYPINKLSKRKEAIAKEKLSYLRDITKALELEYPKLINTSVDWKDLTFETNNITLIHNPITRFSKEPLVWYEITNLLKAAKSDIFIQSPYLVPSRKITKGFFDFDNLDGKSLSILTNSKSSSPNFPAYSSYLSYRKNLAGTGANIYEYQGTNSIHAKSYTVDNDITIIGSFNLDPRSVYLSTETMVVIHSIDVKEDFDKNLNKYLDNSLLVDKNGDYIKSDISTNETPVSLIKNILFSIVCFFSKIIEFLL